MSTLTEAERAFAVMTSEKFWQAEWTHRGHSGTTNPAHAATGADRVGSGAPSVADPRLNCEPHAGAYGVTGWGQSASAVTGAGCVDNANQAVADVRVKGFRGVLGVVPWSEPSDLVTARDNTWHRPFTVLELAILQGLPFLHHGKPLQFTGLATTDRVHIGNLVPPPAAMAIAERMLTALLQHDLGGFALSGGGGVWVLPEERLALQ